MLRTVSSKIPQSWSRSGATEIGGKYESRAWKALRTLFAVCLIAGISYLAGAITANESKPNRSAVALQKTGLPISYSQHYTLHGVSSGRDYFSQTVFQVDYSSERKELFNIMAYFNMTPAEFFAPLESETTPYHNIYNRLRSLSDADLAKVQTFLDWISSESYK